MDNVIILRYGELHLKGKNRSFFENMLIKNIRKKIASIDCNLLIGRGRYIICDFNQNETDKIIKLIKEVFGIHSLSIAKKTVSNLEAITKLSLELAPKSGSFRINSNRADKRFPLTSVELSKEIGGLILDNNPSLTVDLHNPQTIINIDIRDNGSAFIYNDKILCAGGMPVGSAGKGLLLLSGGIDSPVAGYMMAKRGMNFDTLHFHSYPYTSAQAKEKVIELAKILTRYCGNINLICVPLTQIQEEIHKNCEPSYMITMVRRFMMTLAEKIAANRFCGCIINGESLGQVASQTLQSITVTNDVVKTMPIFRPLIGMDKSEIISISQKMDTYETSILPYEDCCTVFLPENPVTKPTIERAQFEQNKISNYQDLIEQALNNLEIIKI